MFSAEPADYLPAVLTRFEGNEVMNYSPLIYAIDQENIAITGRGHARRPGRPTRTGGRGSATAATSDRASCCGRWPRTACRATERVFGDGHYLRPNFVQPYRCKNVLIEGVTIINSPMWEIHPVLCENVTVRGVTVDSHGPNNDGCDPESCRDVLIENCTFDTGDDCIAIKSRPQRRRPADQRAEREHHHPRLHDEGRPRRRDARQRNERRHPQRVRRELPDGQPEPRPRDPPQDQHPAAAATSKICTSATSRWAR